MIGRINGQLLEKNPPQITVDVQGLGYEIDVPMSTFYNLPACGEKVSLYTHQIVQTIAEDLRHWCPHCAGGTFRDVGGRTGARRHDAGSRSPDKSSGYW